MPTVDAPQARAVGLDPAWLVPDWPVAPRVRAFVTTRGGGVSAAPCDTLNLGHATGDDPVAVAENRRRVESRLPAAPAWLRQVHGTDVACIGDAAVHAPLADAAVTRSIERPLAVLVADCLPVLLATQDGAVIGVAHAGWRGLAAGVIERTLGAMAVDAAHVCAWLGPSIGPAAFEVGDDVRHAFVSRDAGDAAAFVPHRAGKWLADLPGLARRRLQRAGVHSVGGGHWCTVADPARFFSYRRDGATGRLGAFLWIDGDARSARDDPVATIQGQAGDNSTSAAA